MTPGTDSGKDAPPDYDNVALVAVTYNPSEQCIQNIVDASTQFYKCFVCDNSEPSSPALAPLKATPHIEVISNSENLGLATALNQLAGLAQQAGFSWIVTLDQDSLLLPNFLQEMLSGKDTYPENVGAVGCNYQHDHGARARFRPSSYPCFQEKITVITSCCLTNLEAWRSSGGFNAEFFIDAIDHEFCLRLRQAGFSVGLNPQVLMHHAIGEDDNSKRRNYLVFPHKHPAWRNYTSARNTMYTIRQHYPQEPRWCLKRSLSLTLEFAAIFLFADKKIERCKSFCRGIRHGWQAKLGGIKNQGTSE